MQALVFEGPWQMPLRELPTPELGPGDVLVRVAAVGVCGSDVHGFTGSTGRRRPGVVMGHEFCGTVAALGADVTTLEVGARVVVNPIVSCGHCAPCRAGRRNLCLNRLGIGWSVDGAFAEFVRVPQENVVLLPGSVSWHQGAMVEPLAVALHAANLTPLDVGDTAVVVGAGPIGLLTLLALRSRGAGRVVVTDLSERRLALARDLGADATVNGREQDAASTVRELTGGLGADVVLEAVGVSATVGTAFACVRTGGQVTWIGNSAPEVQVPMQDVVTRELVVRGAYAFTSEFARAVDLLASGRIDVAPLVEEVAPLPEGPRLVTALADGSLDAVKVVLEP
ncbi:zinc-dependent alcohol dehydrogenase [Deinococcus pimensis]|uniref:zinc-dependent alcohol dehydrogenase n=1 Tax=Deinococcus pimensis TaxID=309888 RepID=UPI0004885985|nr:galactitol-1-phosphate 5-dehydrogenase [Deinococcus pimensis]